MGFGLVWTWEHMLRITEQSVNPFVKHACSFLSLSPFPFSASCRHAARITKHLDIQWRPFVSPCRELKRKRGAQRTFSHSRPQVRGTFSYIVSAAGAAKLLRGSLPRAARAGRRLCELPRKEGQRVRRCFFLHPRFCPAWSVAAALLSEAI